MKDRLALFRPARKIARLPSSALAAGCVHVPEPGIAAGLGNLDRVKHRSNRSAGTVGEVGMPHRPAVRDADVSSVLAPGGDEQDLRVTGQDGVVGRMLVQRAETPGEGDLLPRRNPLVPEHQHQMLEMRPVYLLEDLVVERLRQVEVDDLGAECIRKGSNLDTHPHLRRCRGARWTDVAAALSCLRDGRRSLHEPPFMGKAHVDSNAHREQDQREG
jgi:hypothetical protein